MEKGERKEKPIPKATTPSSEGLWCETCNRSGHTYNTCFASTIRIPSKGKGKGKRQGNASNHGDRNWKSHNFPANYNSDQAFPALHDESSSSNTQIWWEDHELGSTAMDNEPSYVPLHVHLLADYIEHNAYNDDDDEYVSEYIDLVIFAIITNIERYNTYVLNPTAELLAEIQVHSGYISMAESCLNVHIQRIIRTFKASLYYDELMSGEHVGATADVSIHNEQTDITIVNEGMDNVTNEANEITNDEITTSEEQSSIINDANKSMNDEITKANEQLSTINEANKSTNDEITKASEQLSTINEVNKSTNDEITKADEQLITINEVNKSTNDEVTQANNEQLSTINYDNKSMNDEITKANEQLSTINEANKSTNDEVTQANEQLSTINDVNKSTNDEVDKANEQLSAINDANKSTNEEIKAFNKQLSNNEIQSANELLGELCNEKALQRSSHKADIEHFNVAAIKHYNGFDQATGKSQVKPNDSELESSTANGTQRLDGAPLSLMHPLLDSQHDRATVSPNVSPTVSPTVSLDVRPTVRPNVRPKSFLVMAKSVNLPDFASSKSDFATKKPFCSGEVIFGVLSCLVWPFLVMSCLVYSCLVISVEIALFCSPSNI